MASAPKAALSIEESQDHAKRQYQSVDEAVVALCRLRRVAAGGRGSAEAGDAAVRDALGHAAPGSVVWALSRAVSYMDEQGYPEEWEASRRRY